MSSSCSSSSSLFELVNVIKAMATTVAPHSCLPFAGKSFHHMFCFCFMALKALPAGNFGTCPTDLSVCKALDVEAAVLQQSSLAARRRDSPTSPPLCLHYVLLVWETTKMEARRSHRQVRP